MSVSQPGILATPSSESCEHGASHHELYRLGQSLSQPDAALRLASAEMSLYEAKALYDPEWNDSAARDLVWAARGSFDRYGPVPVTDEYDAKSSVCLVRTTFTCHTAHAALPMEEWFTIRFVPSDGLPHGNADLNNCICKDQPVGNVIETALLGSDRSGLSGLVSISRMSAIPAYTVGTEAGDGKANSRRALRYSAAAFAMAHGYVMRRYGGSWRYLTGLCHPKLLASAFSVRNADGRVVPRYTTGADMLGLASVRDVKLDRSAEAYHYPGYFLDVRQLARVLGDLLAQGVLTRATLRHYLGLDDVELGSNLVRLTQSRQLGSLLTARGELVGARITGERLRAYLDRVVEDEPVLYIFDARAWSDEIDGMLEEVERQAYANLPGKPRLFDAPTAHRLGQISFQADGTAVIRHEGGRTSCIPPSSQYDVTQPTMFGLNERLTSSVISPVLGSSETLRDRFNSEWERYSDAVLRAGDGAIDYGTYAYYADRNELVRYCSRYWHRVVAVASNSKLVTDPRREMTWESIQRVFENTTVAVAGGSVGNNILHSVAMDMRPSHLKIADKMVFKMENVNRVRLTYSDLVDANDQRPSPLTPALRNKARVAASQVYSIDPYVTVYVYDEGITEETIRRFILGNDEEPAASVVVDEVDDPRTKVRLREECRSNGVPLIMLTDIGSCVQLDVLPYDRNPDFPLAFGVSDDDVYRALDQLEDNPSDRACFFAFADALVGPGYRSDELGDILAGRSEVPTATVVPQLGSTAAMAGAIAAETIARLRLGAVYPPRARINKHTFQAWTYS